MAYKQPRIGKSVMKHDFSQVPHANIERSRFKRDHGYKTTFDAGYLIPIYVDEALPADTFNLRLSSVARLATPLHPIMDNIRMDFFFFAVPNRLIWDNWQRFMGERDPDPDSSISYLVPQMPCPAGGFTAGSLEDYFGIPPLKDNIDVNSLHHRAYNLIWNEFFRDENLQDSVQVDRDDGPDNPADYVLLKRGKRHDYFTSCLPWPQKGDEIELPLGSTAPVVGDGKNITLWDGSTEYGLSAGASGDLYGSTAKLDEAVGGTTTKSGYPTSQAALGLTTDGAGSHIYADLSTATASTINSLREAFQLQRLLERDARGGTRYISILKAHFKVDSPDARLQRPEYLGGGSSSVSVTGVPATSIFGGEPLGKLGAIGYHSQSGIGFTKSFVEHCVIIGMVCVRADLTYQQGLHKMFQRQTKYDFYWPALAHLGEQTVLNSEIWLQDGTQDTGATGTPDNERVFGYQERWAEYKYFPSLITGELRSDHAVSLDSWHLSQDFATLPELNSDFIEENPPIDRVTAVSAEPQWIFDAYFSLTCTRPMPMYSIPGLIDHF